MSSRPQVLLTRPLAQALVTAEKIHTAGVFEPVIAPLLKIVLLPFALPAETPAALLLTSVNAAEALKGFARNIPVLAVGAATAAAARALGFTDVSAAKGGGDELVELAAARCEPGRGLLLHLAGADVAVDLAGELGARGFHAVRKTVYRAEDITQLAPEVHDGIASGRITAALLYSPRSASLLRGALCRDERARLSLAVLSPAIAVAAGEDFKAVVSASEVNEEALLGALHGITHTKHP